MRAEYGETLDRENRLNDIQNLRTVVAEQKGVITDLEDALNKILGHTFVGDTRDPTDMLFKIREIIEEVEK